MKKHVFEIYDLRAEVKKTGSARYFLSSAAAAASIDNAFCDGENPVASFGTESEAKAYLAAQGNGRIDDFGTYWRVSGLICWEYEKTFDDDGDLIDNDFCGTVAVSNIPGTPIKVQFDADPDGNTLATLHDEIIARCEVPEGASDDFGYLTMKRAILDDLTRHGIPTDNLDFWYDGQEDRLAPDAAADCDVSLDIDYDALA